MKPSNLHKAVYERDKKGVQAALRQGANANSQYLGRPALIWAVQQNHLGVAKALVAAGASLNRKDKYGFTALDQAAGGGMVGIVRFLLQAGARVNAPTCNGSALHTACAYNHLTIAKLLLAYGADTQAKDADGRKPISFTRIGKRNRNTSLKLRNLLLMAARNHH
jgi:ankyrin repeat protein